MLMTSGMRTRSASAEEPTETRALQLASDPRSLTPTAQ
jgi:hypothetical protein